MVLYTVREENGYNYDLWSTIRQLLGALRIMYTEPWHPTTLLSTQHRWGNDDCDLKIAEKKVTHEQRRIAQRPRFPLCFEGCHKHGEQV